MKPPLFGGPRLAMRTLHGNCAVVLQASEACQKDNMYITNQVEFKATASALRRELKKAFPEAPSHAAVLELLAKALGASSYAELAAKLPKEAPTSLPAKSEKPVPPRYPLRNEKGLYDLVKQGGEGIPRRGYRFQDMAGTMETIHACSASVSTATRDNVGVLELNYDDETDVNWNGQATDKDDEGEKLWFTEDSDVINNLALVLVPEKTPAGRSFYEEDDSLPIRKELVQEYLTYALETKSTARLIDGLLDNGLQAPALQEIEGTLMFSLHMLEAQRLLALLQEKQSKS